MKNKFLIGGALGFASLIIVAGAIFFISTQSAGLEIPPPPLVVQIQTPAEDAALSPYAPNLVRVAVLGEGVTSIQLWADDLPLTAQKPNSASTLTYAEFAWQPTTPGAHTLIARAQNAQGNMAQSAPLNVQTQMQSFNPQTLNASKGETLADLAEALELPLDHLKLLNPQINEKQPLEADQPITIPELLPPTNALLPAPPTPLLPVPPNPPAPNENAPLATLFAPNAFNLFTLKYFSPSGNAPNAPSLMAKANGCDANLFISAQTANEIGFTVYRLAEGESTFKKIAALNASAGDFKYEDKNLSDTVTYYVAAFNLKGETPSNIVSVTVSDASCAKQNDSLEFTESFIVPKQALNALYCYAALDGKPWGRLPANDTEFIYASNGKFDLTPHLKNLLTPAPQADVLLKLECWGWQSGALKNLGSVTQIIKPKQNSSLALNGAGFTLTGALQAGSKQIVAPKKIGAQPLAVTTKPPKEIPATYGVQGWRDSDLANNIKRYVVIWNWMEVGCFPPGAGEAPKECKWENGIEGFKVYDTQGKALKTVAGKTSRWTYMESQFPECYIVRAYKGTLESAASKWGCMAPSAPPNKQVTKEIPPPTSLKAVSSVAECLPHVSTNGAYSGNTLCNQALKNGSVILVWNWTAQGCFPPGPTEPPKPCKYVSDIEGYKVYDTVGGSLGVVAQSTPNDHTVAAILPPPPNGVNLANYCFTVRAFKGNLESVSSNEVCQKPTPPTPPELLISPNKISSQMQVELYKNYNSSCPLSTKHVIMRSNTTLTDDAFQVTYINRSKPGVLCDKMIHIWIEGRVSFHLDDLKDQPLEKVSLMFQPTGGFAGLGTEAGTFVDKGFDSPITELSPSCTTALYSIKAMLGMNQDASIIYIDGGDKMSMYKPIPGDLVSTNVSGSTLSPNVYDITTLVQNALQKKSDKPAISFVWLTHEGLEDNNDMCISNLTQPRLKAVFKK